MRKPVEIGDARACRQVDIALAACELAGFTPADFAWLALVAAGMVGIEGRDLRALGDQLRIALSKPCRRRIRRRRP